MSWAKFEKMQTCLEIRDCFNFCWFLRVFGWWQCDQWPLKTNLEMELTILGLNCYCCYCMSRSNCFTKTCANDWTNMFNRHLTKCVGKLKIKICRPFLLCANKQTEPCKTAVGFIQFPKYLDVRSIEILLYSMALWYILVLSIWWVCKKFDTLIKSLVNHFQSKNIKRNKLCSNTQRCVFYFCHIHGTKTSRRTQTGPQKLSNCSRRHSETPTLRIKTCSTKRPF